MERLKAARPFGRRFPRPFQYLDPPQPTPSFNLPTPHRSALVGVALCPAPPHPSDSTFTLQERNQPSHPSDSRNCQTLRVLRQSRRLTRGVSDHRQSRWLEGGGAAQSRMALRATFPEPLQTSLPASTQARSQHSRFSPFPTRHGSALPCPPRALSTPRSPCMKEATPSHPNDSRNCQTLRVLRQSPHAST